MIIRRKELTIEDKLDMTTSELGLPTRIINFLETIKVFTVRSLLNCSRTELMEIDNFGEKSLDEVYKALALIGFKRREI